MIAFDSIALDFLNILAPLVLLPTTGSSVISLWSHFSFRVELPWTLFVTVLKGIWVRNHQIFGSSGKNLLSFNQMTNDEKGNNLIYQTGEQNQAQPWQKSGHKSQVREISMATIAASIPILTSSITTCTTWTRRSGHRSRLAQAHRTCPHPGAPGT